MGKEKKERRLKGMEGEREGGGRFHIELWKRKPSGAQGPFLPRSNESAALIDVTRKFRTGWKCLLSRL